MPRPRTETSARAYKLFSNESDNSRSHKENVKHLFRKMERLSGSRAVKTVHKAGRAMAACQRQRELTRHLFLGYNYLLGNTFQETENSCYVNPDPKLIVRALWEANVYVTDVEINEWLQGVPSDAVADGTNEIFQVHDCLGQPLRSVTLRIPEEQEHFVQQQSVVNS